MALPSVGACATICGDDDGNLEAGDGCSPACANSEAWAVLPTNLDLAPRTYHSSVWTGTELIIWGGGETNLFGDGALFDPRRDGWRSMTQEGAPDPRSAHATAWTGSEMIVWGGKAATSLGDGAYFHR